MLWNWYTIDACFISEGWHVTTHGGFAASCLGATALTIFLEFLRRLKKEYDTWLVRKHIKAAPTAKTAADDGATTLVGAAGGSHNNNDNNMKNSIAAGHFRPTRAEQAIRALLYTLQFVVAYLVMLYVLPSSVQTWSTVPWGFE